MLTFDIEKHEYRWNGLVVPSVTQVIEASCPFQWHGEKVKRAADFGKAGHATLELFERGDLAEFDPAFAGHLEQWVKAKEFILNKFKGVIICDFKTGSFSPTWFIQTAAYQKLYETSPGSEMIEEKLYSPLGFAGTVDRVFLNGSGKIHRVCIRLLEDKFEPHFPKDSYAEDWNIFLSMLNVYRWKEAKKLLTKDGENE